VIVIGEGPSRIKVVIVDIRGDKVRLGIEAPKEVPVHREEVYEVIQKEKCVCTCGAFPHAYACPIAVAIRERDAEYFKANHKGRERK
jgi:carbon storage regulator CsrA